MCLDLANKLGILTDPAEFDSYLAAGAQLNQSSKIAGDEDNAIENEHEANGIDLVGGEADAETDEQSQQNQSIVDDGIYMDTAANHEIRGTGAGEKVGVGIA